MRDNYRLETMGEVPERGGTEKSKRGGKEEKKRRRREDKENKREIRVERTEKREKEGTSGKHVGKLTLIRYL